MFEILLEYQNLFLGGFLTTLKLIGAIALIGIPFGILFGVAASRYSNTVRSLLKSLKFFTKIVPVLVLLFWLHYPLQGLLNVVIDPFWTTIIALGFVNTVAVGYLVFNELELLPKSYYEAGVTLGLSKKQAITNIELPILKRRISPGVLLLQATMLEYTLFASLISVPELFRVSQTINAMVYQPVQIYSLLVIFFMIILIPLHLYINHLQKKTIKYV